MCFSDPTLFSRFNKLFSFITNYDDTIVIRGCKIAVFLMITPVMYDYVGVSKKYIREEILNK